MTRLVIDASVAIKWIFDDPDREADVDTAVAILDHIADGRIAIVQPPHWLAEVSAVLDDWMPRRPLGQSGCCTRWRYR